jgi:hypothetical protein
MINKPKLLVRFAQECLKKGSLLSKIKTMKKTPWPLSFVQYCIKEVDKEADQDEFMGNVADDEGFGGSFSPSFGHSSIFEFHDYQEIWENIEKKFKLKKPIPGSLVIWKKLNNSGHIGIIIKVLDGQRVVVIEGSDSKDREVLKKTRSIKKETDLSLVGILTPWH